MTDKLKGVTVGFSYDIREDEAEEIINAIKLIKGVQVVAPVIRGVDDILNRDRIRLEYREKIYSVLK